MYKKITHNIVEEHFDHPMATKIKTGLTSNVKTTRLDIDDDLLFGRPTTEIFKRGEFKKKLDSYLNNYTQKLIQITDSVAGTEEQLVAPFEELFDTIDDVKNFFNPFYARELGEMVTSSFRNIASTSTMITHNIKAGFDYAPWSRSFDRSTLVGPLNNYNDRWAPYTYQNTIRQLKLAIIKRLNAVKDKDQATIDQATTEAMAAMMAFGEVIYNGIIQQFPRRFTD